MQSLHAPEMEVLQDLIGILGDEVAEVSNELEKEKERSLQTAVFPSPLLTSKEAAAYLRICPKTLRTTCRDEGLEPISIGNKFLYQSADLDRFIEIKAEEQRRASGRNLDIPPFKG